MEDFNKTRMTNISLSNRKDCTLCGVSDVLSFDLHEVVLDTEQGMLKIGGEDLHVNSLSLEKGEVTMEGRIDSLIYTKGDPTRKGESLLTRLFR